MAENNQDSSGVTPVLLRLLALTDGVFAIIMTILVLELKAPSSDTEISGTAYGLLIYAISFLLAGVNWIGHSMIFSIVKKANRMLIWLNIIFLMFASLIPFSANILMNSRISVSLFAYGI